MCGYGLAVTYELTGLTDKVAVVTGAGRMRSIGRPIAVELARAGCDIVLTGTGRSPDRYPDDEKAAGWRDIESVAEEVRALGRTAITAVSDVADLAAVEALADAHDRRARPGRHRRQQRRRGRGADRVPVIDLDPDLWRTVIDVNLTGSFLMSKVFGRLLAESRQRRLDRQHLLDRRQGAEPDDRRLRGVEGRPAGAHRVHVRGGRRRPASGSTPSARA